MSKIVDSHMGKSNIMFTDRFNESLIETLTTIADILKTHSGPKSPYATIVDADNPHIPPSFTRDGIRIIESTTFGSVIENSIKLMATHTGSMVDRASGDGTTSSMLLFIEAMKYIKEQLPEADYITTMELYHKFRDTMNEHITTVTHKVDDFITPDYTREEVIFDIAFHQAYTSSHGDRELAKVAADLFSTTPEEGWDNLVIEASKSELNQKYTLKRDDSQYSIDVNIFNKNMLNADMKTKFKVDSATVIIVPAELTSNSGILDDLIALVDNLPEQHEPIVILAYSGLDIPTTQTLKDAIARYHARTSEDNEFVIFTHHTKEPKLNALMGLCLVTGIDPDEAATSKTPINNVKVSYSRGVLKLDNIYEDTGSLINPLVGSKSFIKLDNALATIDGIIADIKSEGLNYSSREKIGEYRKLYNKLFLTSSQTLLLGGDTHDITSAMDVAEDVLRACKSSLADGFTGGGNYPFLIRDTGRYTNIMHQAFDKAAREMRKVVGVNPDTIEQESVDILQESFSDINPKALADKDFPLIIQPAPVSGEIVKRFGELALRLVASNKLITLGGILVGEDE